MVHLAKLQQMFGQPIIHVAQLGAPLAAFFAGSHAVTGATGVVGETARSYTVRGLPKGLEKSSEVLSGGVSSFSGVPDESGIFPIEIIGWRSTNEQGDKTSVYEMTLNVAAGAPPLIATNPKGGTFDQGVDTELNVSAEGGGLKYRWLKDGEEITSAEHGWINDSTERTVLVDRTAVDEAWHIDSTFDDSA
ncbi:MAG: hypothetical protein ACKVHP_22145 [Verrucomicrobiales bacterium]